MLQKLVEINAEARKRADVPYPSFFSSDRVIEPSHLQHYLEYLDARLMERASTGDFLELIVFQRQKGKELYLEHCQPFAHFGSGVEMSLRCKTCGVVKPWKIAVNDTVGNLGSEHRKIADAKVEQILREFLAAFVDAWRARVGSAPVALFERDQNVMHQVGLRFWWTIEEPTELAKKRIEFEQLDAKRTRVLSELNELCLK